MTPRSDRGFYRPIIDGMVNKMMTDEEFNDAISGLRVLSFFTLADKLSARDTAQREALARVEAERDQMAADIQRFARRVLTAQAHSDGPEFGDGPEFEGWAERSGVAQAEQQEAREPSAAEAIDSLTQPLCVISLRGDDRQKALATDLAKIIRQYHGHDQGAQGAQAGDEHENFEAWHRSVVAGDPPHEKYHDGSYVNQHVNRYWTGWQARAALATQPAAGEPVYQYLAKDGIWVQTDSIGTSIASLYGFETRTLWTAPPAAGEPVAVIDVNAIADYVADYWPMKKHSLEEIEAGLRSIVLESTLPAAAHGDEAVRKDAERYRWVRAQPGFANALGYDRPEAVDRVVDAAHGDEAVLWDLLEALRTATDRQALPGEFIRVMWETGCDWINARAAMRAQGDGETLEQAIRAGEAIRRGEYEVIRVNRDGEDLAEQDFSMRQAAMRAQGHGHD